MDLKKLRIPISRNKNYAKWLKECYLYSKQSNHPSTHNAAVLIKKGKIILKGANIFPMGVKAKKERVQGKNKHIYPNHAERDVIYKAARRGIATEGLAMAMPWLPCIPCANAIISAGIKHLIIHKQMTERTDLEWQEELKNAVQVMREASIRITAYDGKIGVKAYMHSQEWYA